MLYICPPPRWRGQDPCVGITIQVLLSVYVHMYTLLSPPGHADPTAPAAAAPLSTSQPRTMVWEGEEEGNHSDVLVLCAPSAPARSGFWLSGSPAPGLLHILLLGCISTPHSTAPASSPSNKLKIGPPVPSLPHPSIPIPRTQSPAGCWLERAAGMTHHRCSLRGQGGPDTGTETMQRVGEMGAGGGKNKG